MASSSSDTPCRCNSLEALPPRAFSGRAVRRRLLQTDLSADRNGTVAEGEESLEGTHPETTKTPLTAKEFVDQTTRKKKYTPGLNSYLKVELEEDIVDRLHLLACDVRQRVQNMTEPQVDESSSSPPPAAEQQDDVDVKGDDGNSTTPNNTKKKKRPLRFKPRSRTSLHMTFFFGGEVLGELPEDELLEWHQSVKLRLEQSDITVHQTTDDDSSDAETAQPLRGIFRVRQLTLFPPRRNNLVVALLDCSSDWHKLHDDIRDIARNGTSDALRKVTERSKAKWTPHITLGNLYGGTKADLRKLEKELSEMSFDGTDETNNTDDAWVAHATRITMGGPVPEQVSLNWNFTAASSKDT